MGVLSIFAHRQLIQNKQERILSGLSVQSIIDNNIIPPSIQPPITNRKIEDPNSWKKTEIESPLVSIVNEITEKNLNILPSFEMPQREGQNEDIECAIMMQIRRRKMKKHQLKKLRKRDKFLREKRNQKRELKREKEFQADLLGQIREAEAFSAEEYVSMKLAKLKTATKKSL